MWQSVFVTCTVRPAAELYITSPPCNNCGLHAIAAGIRAMHFPPRTGAVCTKAFLPLISGGRAR